MGGGVCSENCLSGPPIDQCVTLIIPTVTYTAHAHTGIMIYGFVIDINR